MSTDSLSVSSNAPNRRPLLKSKSRSFNNTRVASPPPNNPRSEEYRSYRDDFLSNRHQFTGQVFGVPLAQSLSVASAEVIVQSELVSFGRIPILVAKCGAFLKANGLQTSGIFRIAGNNKRVKELQYIFSTPPSYGTKFNNWDGFTVHDAASVLRRYLNNLEEPLIPLELYDQFRKPLQERPRILKHMAHSMTKNNDANEDTEDFDEYKLDDEEAREKRRRKLRHKKRLTRDIRSALKEYEMLFISLSSDSKQLLIYLLDLLSLFAQQSDINLMTARNLAAIFQPSILSHPEHDMDPKEYELSRFVVEFLIEYSYKLLPHLLKATKPQKDADLPKTNSSEAKPIETKPAESSTIPQTIVLSPESSHGTSTKAVEIPTTPTDQRLQHQDVSYLTPPGPSFLESQNRSLKGRPHSKSLSHAHAPSDMITTRKRTARFSWLNRALSSDTGEFSATEEEEEDEDDIHSPVRGLSSSLPKQHLHVPRVSRSMSGNSTTSNGARPLSLAMNKSIEELASTLGLKKPNGKEASPIATDEEEDGRSRSSKRNSWFQRLRSRSRSATRS